MTSVVIALIVFIVVMALIIFDVLHRSVAAVLGVVLLLITGVLNVESAAGYVDFNTIGVLVGMMLFVAVVKRSGLFEYLAVKTAKLAGGNPWNIMVAFLIITAVLSSILDNVTTVLLMGPITIAITKTLKISPVPFFMTQIMASNIGGTATLIGDPPNIMIGSAAGLNFLDFLASNGPVIVIILLATVIYFRFVYKRQLKTDDGAIKRVMELDERKMILDKRLLGKSVAMTLLTVCGFILSSTFDMETSIVALSAAVVMLLIGRQNPEEILLDVEWATIVFFIGLFIVVGGLVETGVIDKLANVIMNVTNGNQIITMVVILWVSALLSSTLDNIPFVATMIPLIGALGGSGMDITPLWWALSLGACLGGNGTLIGASANVVLAGISEKNGHPISYMQFLKVGFPLMLLSVIICTVYLLVLYA